MSAQQQYIGLAAKFVSLFSIAIMSSFLFPIVSILIRYGPFEMQFGLMDSLDMVINIVCLYLQYAFADKEYRAYCVVADGCSRKWMTHNMKESVARIKLEKWVSKSRVEAPLEMADLDLGEPVQSMSAETADAEEDQNGNHQIEV